jgi:predicted PurR-regulated permease PerM
MHPGDDHAHDDEPGAAPARRRAPREEDVVRHDGAPVLARPGDDAIRAAEDATAAADAQAAGAPPPRRRDRLALQTPVDVRSGSAVVLAVLLSLYALRWAAEIVIPVLMGLLFSYALSPVVDRLCRVGLPRAVSAGVVLAAVVGGLAWATYSLSDQANNLLESLPDAAQKLRSTLHSHARRNDNTTMAQVQKAAATLELAAADAGSRPAPGVLKVQVVKPGFNVQDYLFTGTLRAAEAALQAIVVAFITYFLLAAGDTFRRKLARIAGPSFAKRKITVQALDEISDQIRRYLLVQLLASVIVGAATGLAFLALGMNNAAAWGVVAGVLNLIPYVGTAVTGGASAVVALLQFGTIEMALAVAAVSVVAHIVTGWGLTPWLTSRTSRLNAVVVFIGVLAWGWLWGVWGLLLGTPILMAVKAVCDRVEDWKPLGELMGGTERSGERVASGTAEA